MKQTKKLNCCYSVNVDEDTAKMIEVIAEQEQRKPRELLRLLLKPALLNKWAEIQRQEHPENQAAPTVAKFQA
jgi:hypothetical protein